MPMHPMRPWVPDVQRSLTMWTWPAHQLKIALTGWCSRAVMHHCRLVQRQALTCQMGSQCPPVLLRQRHGWQLLRGRPRDASALLQRHQRLRPR